MILCLISTILIQDLSAMHLPYHTSSPAPNQTGKQQNNFLAF
nr:hypothetical protein [Human betaherpesvirus 6]QFV47765.1 hypothetical protein [Human betaherpesvirus 6]QFX43662.1 hypothetical protein [Human betaherpesvirus 6]